MSDAGIHMTGADETPITERPRLATIIVNYQAGDLVAENITSIVDAHQRIKDARIYIVDNASPNGDGARLTRLVEERGLSDVVEVIAEDTNWGFAEGNNVALRLLKRRGIRPDYVFLLNPDAYLLDGALPRLIEFMEQNPKAGIAGARLEGGDGEAQISAFRFATIASEFAGEAQNALLSKVFAERLVIPPQEERTYEVEWVCGAAAIIRYDVFDDIGFFDNAYFLYYEETDFMLQARRAGWQTWYVHDAKAVHLVGQSTGVQSGRQEGATIPTYLIQSRKYYFRKNHGAAYAFFADVAWVIGVLCFFVSRRLTGRYDNNALANLRLILCDQREC